MITFYLKNFTYLAIATDLFANNMLTDIRAIPGY